LGGRGKARCIGRKGSCSRKAGWMILVGKKKKLPGKENNKGSHIASRGRRRNRKKKQGEAARAGRGTAIKGEKKRRAWREGRGESLEADREGPLRG